MAHQTRDQVPVLDPGATVRQAARAMTDADARSAFIATDDGLCGVITDRDVVRAVADKRRLGSTRVTTVGTGGTGSAAVDDATRMAGESGLDRGPLLDAVLRLAVAVASPGGRVDGASVVIRTADVRAVVTSSDGLQALEQVQVEDGAGPALAAIATGEPQGVEFRLSKPRWPNYYRAALAQGTHRVLSLPLVVHGDPVGALSGFWRSAGPVAPDTERALGLVAERTALAVARAGALDRAAADDDDAEAEAEADEKTVITEAREIIRSRKDYSEDEAFATLRHASEHTRRPLPEVAREVVELPRQMRPKTS
jgi:CBS domain-containing protein